jgi:hypothetical protein
MSGDRRLLMLATSGVACSIPESRKHDLGEDDELLAAIAARVRVLWPELVVESG